MHSIPRVVIPTRDRPVQVGALLGQLRYYAPQLSITVVDNSSSDLQRERVRQACEHFGASYRLCSRRGKAHALNMGLASSEAEFVIVLDDDVQLVAHDWWRAMLDVLYADPSIAYVSGRVDQTAGSDYVSRLWTRCWNGLSKGTEVRILTGPEARQALRERTLIPRNLCAGANCALRVEALRSVGGFEPALSRPGPIGHGVTLEIAYRLARSGNGIAYEPRSVVTHAAPADARALIAKRYLYAKGDAVLPICAARVSGDWRWLLVIATEVQALCCNGIQWLKTSSPREAVVITATVAAELFAYCTAPIRFARCRSFRSRSSEPEYYVD